MKILIVSSYLPYPLHSGGQVRLYNLIKELSGKHEITLICEKRKHQTEEDVKAVEKICKKVITVPRRKQWTFYNTTRSAFSNSSFLVTGHTNLLMRYKIEEELMQEKFDLIHVETFYVMQNLPHYVIASIAKQSTAGDRHVANAPRDDENKIPTVLAEHNIEYQVYQRFVDHAPVILKPLLAIDIAKIKKEERYFWKQATKVVAVSENDKKVMEQAGISPVIVSNGVNVDEFSFKEKSFDKLRTKKILFIGDFKWIQNQDSIRFIIKDIWPILSRKSKVESRKLDFKLWIVARSIPGVIQSLTKDPNVIFDEESSIKSAPEIFQEADILLAPIRVGGGTSYKILESMSCGTPVVTMQMSADAIAAKDKKHLIVGKNAQELAQKTVELLEDKRLYEKVAKNGRKLIEEKYSWKTIAKDLENVYKGVVK